MKEYIEMYIINILMHKIFSCFHKRCRPIISSKHHYYKVMRHVLKQSPEEHHK